MTVKRKLDGTVDESSADREIHKSDATGCYLHTVLHNTWVKAGRGLTHQPTFYGISGKVFWRNNAVPLSNPSICLTDNQKGIQFENLASRRKH